MGDYGDNANLEDLYNRTMRLINRHMDFDALSEELLSMKSSNALVPPIYRDRDEVHHLITDQTIFESLKLQATMSEMQIEGAATQMILKRICKLSEKQIVISADDGNLSSAITAFKRVGSTLTIHDLSQYQDKFQHCLPLDSILDLHENNIMELKDYLIVNVSNKSVLKEFICSLQRTTRHVESIKIDQQNVNSTKITAGILTHLIKYAYGFNSSNSKALKKMSGYILFTILKSHLQHLTSLPSSKPVTTDKPSILSIIKDNLQNDTDTLRRCFTQMISLWVTDSPNLKVSDAISTQHTWIASKQNERLTMFYKEMATCLGLTHTISTMSNILERREVNWRNLLSFTSALLISFPDSPQELSELIDDKLKNGLETMSVEYLAISFLLIRQLSLEGGHAFMSYTSWFQEKFGTHSTLTSSNRAFRFFIKFLSDIVPYEPVRYLKAHIVKPAVAPSSCTEKLKEYCILARVRISELGGSLAEISEESEQNAEVQKDVKRVLDEYEKTKKVPKSLMEASIFHKAYFCKKFLPALMKPKPLPAIPDASMRLIEDLVKVQKIPKNMYSAYKEGCKKENAKLLEEVMLIDDDSDFKEEEENPYEQLHNILEIIRTQILENNEGNVSSSPTLSADLLTRLNRILHSVKKLQTDDIDTHNDTIDLCVDCKLHKDIAQIANDLLLWVGKFQQNITVLSTNGKSIIKSISNVLKVTSEHRLLTAGICHLIWRFCTHEFSSAHGVIMEGIVIYLVAIGSMIQVKIPIFSHCKGEILKSNLFAKDIENWEAVATSSLSSAVEYSFQFNMNRGTMSTTLKFLCQYIHTLLCSEKDLSPQIIQSFLYLGKRIEHWDMCKSCNESTNANYSPPEKCRKTEQSELAICMDFYQNILNNINVKENDVEILTPVLFLKREMFVDTRDDILSSEERQHLYSIVFFGNDINQSILNSVINVILDQLVLEKEWKVIRNQEVLTYFCESLPLMLESCHPPVSNGKLLYNIISERTRVFTSYTDDIYYDIQIRNEISSMCKLLLHLPEEFLFKQYTTSSLIASESLWNVENVENSSIFTENQKYTSLLINEYLMHWNDDSSFIFSLPQKLSSHLISGIIKTNYTMEECSNFLIEICPCIFTSLVSHWKHDHKLQLLVKLRRPNLHSSIKLITQAFIEHKSGAAAFNMIPTLVHKFDDTRSWTDMKRNIFMKKMQLCFTCILFDIKHYWDYSCIDDVKSVLHGIKEEVAGYMFSCGVLSLESLFLDSNVQEIKRWILEQCLSKMTPEYACNTVLKNSLPGISSLVEHCRSKIKDFNILVLMTLKWMDIPQQILTSKFFLLTLVHLKEESSKYLEKNKHLEFADILSDIRSLENLAVRNAPNQAVIDAFKISSVDNSLAFLLQSEAARRKLLI